MERNKKRLIFFMPSMEGGGVEKNLIIISNYVSKFIENVNIITFDNSFNKYFCKKIKIINFKKNKKKKYSKYFKYICCIWLLIKEYFTDKNILVFTFQANIYGIILSYFLNFKIISRSNSSPSGWNNNIIKNMIFSFFIKKANKVIVNSKEFQKEFKTKFSVNAGIIYNPLNKSEIIRKSKIKNKSLTPFFKGKNFKIINIGRLTHQKDHLTLIKALNIISKKINFRMLIIGYGINKNIIKKKIDYYNLNKFIKIINNKYNPYPYLRHSDLFVLSSKFEGLPNVILEAQTLKKYVISSDCPTGPKEILMNGKLGSLFKVGDYKKLATLIINYIQNKKKYEKKIYNAYKQLSRFDYELNCKKYLSVINYHL